MMAYTRMKTRKNGSRYYEISVSRGYGKSPYTRRWNVPEGLSKKSIDRQLALVATQFELDCKAGKVKTRAEKREEAEHTKEKELPIGAGELLFQVFCETRFEPHIKSTCSENTRYNYNLQLKQRIYPILGARPLSSITSGDINQILREIQAQNSTSLAIKAYSILKSAFKMAYSDALIAEDPMVKVNRPSMPKREKGDTGVKCCSAEDLVKICDQLKSEPFVWQVLVRFLIDTGVRVGECTGLLWNNVNLETGTVKIDGSLTYSPNKGVFRGPTKNGKAREFKVDSDIISMLKVLKAQQEHSIQSEYVFTQSRSANPIHPQSPLRFLKRLGKKCGIENLHPHMLRHSFASIAITNGADIASVSEKLGHSDKAVTLRMYTHATPESIDAASEAFRNAIKSKHSESNSQQLGQ